MSTPIDKLLISVEIEQGSNLENLHKMLKDLQKAGGAKKFKADVDLSGVASKVQIGNVHDKINELTRILKPLIEKFEPLLESCKDLLQEHIIAFAEFVKGSLSWRSQFDEQFGFLYNDLMTRVETLAKLLKDQIEGTSTTGKSDDLSEITFFLANIQNAIEKINESLDKLPNEFTKTKKYMDRKFREALKPLTKELKEVINLASAIQEGSINMETISAMIEGISLGMNGIKELLEQLKTIPQKSLDLEEFIQDLREILDLYIDNKFERFENIMVDVRRMFKEIATRGDILEIRSWWKNAEEFIKEKSDEANRDYFTFKDDVERIRIRLDKIKLERTEIQGAINTSIRNRLKEFKDKLDANLQRVIGGEFTGFLDALAATADVRAGGGKLTQMGFIKPFGEMGAGEDVSGFMRSLLSRMLKQPTEMLLKNINLWLQQDMSRRIQEMSPIQLTDLGKFFGVALSKSESAKEILSKVLGVVDRFDITELLSGVMKKTPETLDAELITKWSDQLTKNNSELFETRRAFHDLSGSVDSNTRWLKDTTQKVFMPTLQIVKRIDAKVSDPTQEDKNLKNDMKNKGEPLT